MIILSDFYSITLFNEVAQILFLEISQDVEKMLFMMNKFSYLKYAAKNDISCVSSSKLSHKGLFQTIHSIVEFTHISKIFHQITL